MSFLPAVQREIDSRQPTDPVRLALEYLKTHANGHGHAIPLERLVTHLNDRGVAITKTGFQQNILAASRSSDYFIGSGPHGYFLINTIEDAMKMKEFYENRIQAETQNLNNLCRQAGVVGWNI